MDTSLIIAAVGLIALIGWRIFFSEAEPFIADESHWHATTTWFPVMTIEKTLAYNVWRRRRSDGKWEYSERAITDEEWDDRQW